jgi:hypothetical protein
MSRRATPKSEPSSGREGETGEVLEWIMSGWVSEAQTLGIPLRKRSHQPVELTVLHAVPDFVINVVSLPTGERFVPDAASTKGENDEGHRNSMEGDSSWRRLREACSVWRPAVRDPGRRSRPR